MNIKLILIILSLNFTTLSLSNQNHYHPAYLNEWCFIDQNGIVYPWFTKPFLDQLTNWNIKDWTIFEWGAGYSTGWFAINCKHITSVENSTDWANSVKTYLKKLGQDNYEIKVRDCDPNDIAGTPGDYNSYVNAITENQTLYDCIVIDGMCRNTCAELALKYIKPGGIIILDNANQGSIGLNSIPTFNLFKAFEHRSFQQPGHSDWKTDYWIIK